jgi:hypothetical protein
MWFLNKLYRVYKVGLKSNETKCMAQQLAILWPCLRHQPRRTFLLGVQCNFQLDSFNTSDLTVSCVSVCSSDALWKWRNEISSSITQSNFASHLMKIQLKRTKNYGEHAVLRAQVFRWHKAFLDGQDSVDNEPCSGRPCMSKTDENVTKVRALVRSDRRLTVRMIGTVMRSLNDSGKGFIVSGQNCRHLDAASQQRFLSNCHLRERIFDQKGYSSGSTARILAWSESMWHSFSQNSNSTSKVVILELWTTSKRSWQSSWGHFHMKTSSTATGSGSSVSCGVWLPKGIMLICCSIVNKKFYSISLIITF